MKFSWIIQNYQQISDYVNAQWPLSTKNEVIFTRTMKVLEELGEMADEILSSMHLQRKSKLEKYSRINLEDEFADVLGSLIMLGIELEIDMEKVIERKIAFTNKRFGLADQSDQKKEKTD